VADGSLASTVRLRAIFVQEQTAFSSLPTSRAGGKFLFPGFMQVVWHHFGAPNGLTMLRDLPAERPTNILAQANSALSQDKKMLPAEQRFFATRDTDGVV
jgi:hypothetical protein